MAIIRKAVAKDEYTKIDNNVIRDRELTDQAKLLYVFMAGFSNGFQLNDRYIEKSLQWSSTKIEKYKKELKLATLIYVDKIDRQTYLLYIGTSKVTASQVRKNWALMESKP